MLEKILRRTLFKGLSESDQNTQLLLKDLYKLDFVVFIILLMLAVFPIAAEVSMLIDEHTWYNIILGIVSIIVYTVFIVWFINKFSEPIQIFKGLVRDYWYGSIYPIKGNALNKSDFNEIKGKNKKLYNIILTSKCRGHCYGVCFELLKCLTKGEIKFIAIKAFDDDEECKDNYYTMHVLYVYNNWGFDTYSNKQYPLDEILKVFEAKEYKTFSYNDIEGKDFDEFKSEISDDFAKWCVENDCYQILMPSK